MDAQVDLDAHQVEAALFAFKSPRSKGVTLVDEVGLGKTIEAGILLSQLWAGSEEENFLLSVPQICAGNGVKSFGKSFFWNLQFLETKILTGSGTITVVKTSFWK
jgi:hypothetical protein